ncbi:uncharacterized protein LOC100906380 [Galendromus occidentalis]|uniref:Uncharacterized protein LOC100906380 n=1 Tax=Galendromus occidentalis TaxID=34638 RepID=A0AAJ6QYW5_9ACAR|nr:uncharacterized protein LOC100906380 [Galendromus occidentalis]
MGKESLASAMKLDMSADSITVSRIPFRHNRVGSIRYIVLLAGCLVSLALVLLIAGAIMTALIFTEVRPPTADENYNRYLGSDWRSVIGPLMMGMAGFMVIMGCVLTVMGYRSAAEDRRLIFAMQKAAEMDTFTDDGEFR